MNYPIRRLILSCVVLISATAIIAATSATKSMSKGERPVIYHVLFHSPGKNWVDSLSFKDQPGVADHVNYMKTFLESKKLVEGGPFLDNSGGMMIFNVDKEEAEKIANNDPAVKSGLLNVTVKPWMQGMTSK